MLNAGAHCVGFRYAQPNLRGCMGIGSWVGWVERSETQQL